MGQHRLASSNSNQYLMHQQAPAFDASAEHLREKLQPLNTQRLKILRQATKSFIVSDLPSLLARSSCPSVDEHHGQR